jgi:uncharacterized protein YifN (PemK superfamily)
MIKFHPKKGTVLSCDFSKGFEKPEIIKVRPVVVVTPQLERRHALCTVVPLSTVEPIPLQRYQRKMSPLSLTPKLQDKRCWAKCDMLYTVGLARLDRIRERTSDGKRIYLTAQASSEDMEAIEIAILNGLGLRKYLR